MTVSGSIVGREIQLIQSQSNQSWGTEGTGTFYKWHLLEDGWGVTQDLDDIEESGSVWVKSQDLGITGATFAPREALRFDSIHGIAMVLGDGAYITVAEENAGKDDHKHTIYPDEDNNGDFETIGRLIGSSTIHSMPSVKYRGFTVSGQDSPQRIEVTYDTLVSNLDNASAVITASGISGATAELSGNGGRAFFRNFTFRIAAQSGATALAGGDAISNVITGFEWTVTRSLSEERTNTSGLEIDEPLEDGYLESTLTLQLRNQDSDTEQFLTDCLAGTAKMLDFEITGAAASTATGTVANASFKVSAPHAVVIDPDPGTYSGPGKIPASITFKLLGTSTTSDTQDMAFLDPFRLEVINAQSAKAIA